MDKVSIDHQKTGYLSQIVLDYITDKEQLKQFYKYTPKLNEFKKVIADKLKEGISRDTLADTLLKQYQDSDVAVDDIKKNIESLRLESTFTVTTGHQLCLFTGPLYFVYKLLSAINLAESLSKEYSEFNFVPVYWMASEDHDFEEINHFNLFNKRLAWDTEEKGSVGRLSTDGIKDVMSEVKVILGDNENAEDLLSIFKTAYTNQGNLANATRYFVNQLFSKYGLVVIDGDDKKLKQQIKPILKDEIKNQSSFKEVSQTNIHLGEKYKIQVNPREINLFYLKDGLRERIVNEENNYKINNTDIVFSGEEILKEVDEYPERFSPNVLTRPLYQEKILPNIAYIGGGGELAYWLQLKSLFEHHKINYPILLLRNSVLLVDKTTNSKWEKLGFSSQDLFDLENELIKRYVAGLSDMDLELTQEHQLLDNLYSKLQETASKVDGSLEQALKAEHTKQKKTIDNWKNKFEKAEKKREEVAINQIKRIKSKLFPENGLQERNNNILEHASRSNSDLISEIKTQLDPLKFDFSIITPS